MQRSLADWLSHIERIHPKSIDMGLERIRIVSQRLGLKRPARKVITVGGTNGKGSTVAFVESIVGFGTAYGGIARDDHRLFVDAFRNRMIPDLYDDVVPAATSP